MAINEQNNSGSTWSLIRAAGNKYYCTNGADAQAGLSSALGSCGTRLIDHVNAYSTLSRQGVYMPQTSIIKVTNSNGETLKEYKASSKQVINPQAAYIVTDILGDAKARAGLGWNQDYLPALTGIGVHAAVKTGTSNGEKNGKVASKDIWAAGYTPNLSMAVWFGNSDTSVLKSGSVEIVRRPKEISPERLVYGTERYPKYQRRTLSVVLQQINRYINSKDDVR